MQAARVGLWTVAFGTLAVLVLGGCPELPLPGGGDAGPGTPAGGGPDDATVFRVLAALAEDDSPSTDEAADDESAHFGEDGGLYEVVPPEAVEISEDAVLAEAHPNDVGPPGPHGRLAGQFLNDRPDSTSDESGGLFRGRWFLANGEVRGVLRGEYHPVPADQLPDDLTGGGVFHGKYIDPEGHFRGFLRGRYGHTAEGRGLFYGRWHDRHHRLVGVLKGHWDDDPNINGGRFAGRWVAFDICAEVASLPPFEFPDGDFGGLDALNQDPDANAPAPPPEPPMHGEPPIHDEPDVRHHWIPPCIHPNMPFGLVRGWHAPYPPPPPDGPGDEAIEPQPSPTDEPPPPPDHDAGLFHGRWLNPMGHVLGHVRGRYRSLPPPPPPPPGEEADDGEPIPRPPHGRILGVLHGRLVDRFGRFRGFVRGVYGRSIHGLGVFRGRCYDADGQEKGVVFGRWAEHPFRPGGPFFGFWNGRPMHDHEPSIEE